MTYSLSQMQVGGAHIVNNPINMAYSLVNMLFLYRKNKLLLESIQLGNPHCKLDSESQILPLHVKINNHNT